jgi:hypothetical protein
MGNLIVQIGKLGNLRGCTTNFVNTLAVQRKLEARRLAKVSRNNNNPFRIPVIEQKQFRYLLSTCTKKYLEI